MSSTMGTLHYGGSEAPIHIEERALAHLKVIPRRVAMAQDDTPTTASWTEIARSPFVSLGTYRRSGGR
ncbi:hypothetical protein FH969_14385 [Miniimonas arenae]|uniref:Uncharacterized protein n=1 Tax=Miniimonas arenae TaxID=676201 RepID=A0A5C5B7K6_9MICO|nr:hypothetical protein [Miniimonas arenae]TNU72880.1 hypothetical protein FH969_14385 [Miniimonas arenae]